MNAAGANPSVVSKSLEEPQFSAKAGDVRQQPAGMTRNEKITLCLSALAFLASLAAIYFQFFYVKRDVRASVFAAHANHNVTNGVGTVWVQLAFANQGSQSIIIKNVSIVQNVTEAHSKDTPPPSYSSGGTSEEDISWTSEFPILLQAGELKIATVTNLIDYRYVYDADIATDERPNRTNPRQIQFDLRLDVIDPSGQLNEITKPVFEMVVFTNDFHLIKHSPVVFTVFGSN